MSLFKSKTAKFFVGFVALAMIVTFVAAPSDAKAATAAELQAQINALMAQINSLQGVTGTATGTGIPAGFQFTSDLTAGSTGTTVMYLQMFLNANGFTVATAGAGSPGMETSTFGPATRAALAKYQSAQGIAPAVGYFGPITRANVNAKVVVTPPVGGNFPAGCTSSSGFSSTTGMSCSPVSTLPAGCTSTSGFSPVTGLPCSSTGTPTTPTTGGALQGGAGSVVEYKLTSDLSSEEVGEDAEDVEVAGLSIEADDSSDIELTAVRLVFDEGTATSDFEDYASEVSVWFNGEEFARVDATDFNDDNNWSRTLSLDRGAIIRGGDTGELIVAVTGASNLDTNDVGKTWTVDFRSVRFNDANGDSTSEDPATATRTFSFESFATAASSEFKISDGSDDINKAHTIRVDATDVERDVVIASFKLKAEGDSDLEINKFGANITVGGAATNVDGVVNGGTSPGIKLMIEGQQYGTASYQDDLDGVNVGTSEDVLFDDVDYTIPAGDTVNVEITADIQGIDESGIAEGDTIAVTIGELETDQTALVKIEDESGTALADAEKTGSISAGASELRSTGIIVTLVNVDNVETAAGTSANDDVVTKHIIYKVTSFGGVIYVANTAAATIASDITNSTITTNGILYRMLVGGTATVPGSGLTQSVNVTNSSSGVVQSGLTNNVIKLPEDGYATFDLAITKTNSAANPGGTLQDFLQAVGWAITDSSTFNVYDFNLVDFKTPVTPSN